METARDFLIGRVHTHRHVGCCHHWDDFVAGAINFKGEVFVFEINRVPDMCARGRLGELPLIAEEQVKIAVVPLDRVGSPWAFDPGCCGVDAFA